MTVLTLSEITGQGDEGGLLFLTNSSMLHCTSGNKVPKFHYNLQSVCDVMSCEAETEALNQKIHCAI